MVAFAPISAVLLLAIGEWSGNATPLDEPKSTSEEPRPRSMYAQRLESLLEAAEKGHVSDLFVALKRGADVNDKDENGDTALMRAAARGHEAIVVILLARGARPNEKNGSGQTALMKAAEKGHVSIIKYIVSPATARKEAEDYLREAVTDGKLGTAGTVAVGDIVIDSKD